MQTRNYWVDIETSDGTRVGRGPLRASNFRHISRLSACGEFSFAVSAADPNLAVLAEKRIAVCKYINRHGELMIFGGGVIDKIAREVSADGIVTIHVSGNDLARELSYRSVGALDLSGVDGAGVEDAPDQIMAMAPAGWSVSNGDTLTSVYAGFDGESVLHALTRVGEHIGEHWRLGSGRSVEWLGPASTFLASGVRAVQHVNAPVAAETVDNIALIASLAEESDAADLITRAIPRGSGNGGVILTLATATASAPSGYTVNLDSNYVVRDNSESTYGRIERVLDYKEIGPISNTTPDMQAAANMLLQATIEHLRRYGAPQKFYRINLVNVNQILRPGTTLRCVYRQVMDGHVVYDLDDEFILLEVESQVSDVGVQTTSVLISTIDRLPQSDSEYLAQQSMQARVLAAHQQLSASVDTFTYRDELDNSKGASFRFWLGDEYTSIQRAILRFRIQPLRSTVKSVAGEATTTASGGGSTSGSGGGQTATGGSHLHNTEILNMPPNVSDVGWAVDGGFIAPVSNGGPSAGAIFQVGVNNSHSHEISNHTHTTPNHTHSLTPEVSMEYGIFEEGGGNTLAKANLVIKLNGGSDLNASVVDIGNGWYELDITDPLTDAVFRPSQENNEIAITTAVAKTARIEAQITIRGVVQAIAYG